MIGLEEIQSSVMACVGFSTHCLWNGVGPNERLQRVFEISEMKGHGPFFKEFCQFSLICLSAIGVQGN